MLWRSSVLALFGALVCVATALAAVKPGTQAPDFKLRGLDGKDHALSDYRGQVVFVNFFGYT